MKKFIIPASAFFMPFLAFAQNANFNTGVGLGSVYSLIFDLFNKLIPFFIALAVVYFVWGVISYILASDDDKKSAARNHIIYGVIALFVIVSVWGLVNLLGDTFGLNTTTINAPTYPAP